LCPPLPEFEPKHLKANGSLFDDFCIISDKRCLHVFNAPSPAASLEIGRYVARLLQPAVA
jgi:hypothetical protein